MSKPDRLRGAGRSALLRPAALVLPLLVLPLLCAGYAHASNLDVPPAPPAAPESRLVRELLEVDAQRALDAERRIRQDALRTANIPAHGAPPSTTPVKKASPPAPKEAPIPRLMGIAGVGAHLSAIVESNGREVIYRRGTAAPVAGRDPGLRLLRIASPCAYFLDAHDRSLAICVNGVNK